jgi:aerobic carbon-monoxide dehydrogenase medium subunit
VKPPAFDYEAPESVGDAVALLAGGADAKVLAGGQSLVPLLSMRLAFPDLLVDLHRIDGLDRITRAGGHLVVGAMARQRQAERDDAVLDGCPLVARALAHVAHPQIRTRGTVAGSVVHADPAAELPAVAVALDARVRAVGPAGERTIEAADLYLGMLTTSLAEDEVVVAVEFPVAPPDSGAACVEVARRSGDYALCGAAAQVTVADGVVSEARVALFGVADRPVRAVATEAKVAGRPVGEAPGAVAAAIAADVEPTHDTDLPADYRRQLAAVVTKRAISDSLEGVA